MFPFKRPKPSNSILFSIPLETLPSCPPLLWLYPDRLSKSPLLPPPLLLYYIFSLLLNDLSSLFLLFYVSILLQWFSFSSQCSSSKLLARNMTRLKICTLPLNFWFLNSFLKQSNFFLFSRYKVKIFLFIFILPNRLINLHYDKITQNKLGIWAVSLNNAFL